MRFAWEHLAGLLGLLLLAVGHYMGLFVAPPERMMGDVGRIFYVHVPVAMLSMGVFFVAFLAALAYLMSSRPWFDWLVESTVEVGVVLNVLLLALGSIWAKPTWGVWWTWDPRLTSATMMLITFVGVIMLRQATRDPDRRATWSAVATVLAFVNVPITYYSVRWWRSLHQIQSSPDTVSDPMVLVFRINLAAMALVILWFIVRRWRIAKAASLAETPPPLGVEVTT
jgi:heme exporter protein C